MASGELMCTIFILSLIFANLSVVSVLTSVSSSASMNRSGTLILATSFLLSRSPLTRVDSSIHALLADEFW